MFIQGTGMCFRIGAHDGRSAPTEGIVKMATRSTSTEIDFSTLFRKSSVGYLRLADG